MRLRVSSAASKAPRVRWMRLPGDLFARIFQPVPRDDPRPDAPISPNATQARMCTDLGRLDSACRRSDADMAGDLSRDAAPANYSNSRCHQIANPTNAAIPLAITASAVTRQLDPSISEEHLETPTGGRGVYSTVSSIRMLESRSTNGTRGGSDGGNHGPNLSRDISNERFSTLRAAASAPNSKGRNKVGTWIPCHGA